MWKAWQCIHRKRFSHRDFRACRLAPVLHSHTTPCPVSDVYEMVPEVGLGPGSARIELMMAMAWNCPPAPRQTSGVPLAGSSNSRITCWPPGMVERHSACRTLALTCSPSGSDRQMLRSKQSACMQCDKSCRSCTRRCLRTQRHKHIRVLWWVWQTSMTAKHSLRTQRPVSGACHTSSAAECCIAMTLLRQLVASSSVAPAAWPNGAVRHPMAPARPSQPVETVCNDDSRVATTGILHYVQTFTMLHALASGTQTHTHRPSCQCSRTAQWRPVPLTLRRTGCVLHHCWHRSEKICVSIDSTVSGKGTLAAGLLAGCRKVQRSVDLRCVQRWDELQRCRLCCWPSARVTDAAGWRLTGLSAETGRQVVPAVQPCSN